MSNYQRGETEAVNDFIAALHTGKIKPTARDSMALCTALHAATIDLPEFNYLTRNFDDLADFWHEAIENWTSSEEYFATTEGQA